MFKVGEIINDETMPCVPFQDCIAKTCPDGTWGTKVFDHCRYSGYVAENLYALLPPPVRRRLPLETPFYVSLHDIGKVSPGFEGKYFMRLLHEEAPDWAREVRKGGYSTDHALIGANTLRQRFHMAADHPLVRSIAAHHGFAPEFLRPTKDGTWQDERVSLIKALEKEFVTSLDAEASSSTSADLLAGITCVADWIASDISFFPPGEAPLSSEDGRKRASAALSVCGFTPVSFRHGLTFRDVFHFDPYPAQQAFLEALSSPGVYVLEAPMGMGKTESALYAAYRLVEAGFHSGIYFALPTRLTSDRIHERVTEFLAAVTSNRTAVKLAHGQAWLKEFEFGAEGSGPASGSRPPPWFNPAKRGLLFPFAVGTIDQALMAVINVKHSFVRSYALAGKVVILDEVHSYDAYTGVLLDELVARLRTLGCTVIILSATLTAARRLALLGGDAPYADGYPLVSGIREATGESVIRQLEPPPTRTIGLRWIDASTEPPIVAAITKARAGSNVLCIANTVATAQEWFRFLKRNTGEDEFPIGLLHSKFIGADRERIEKEWMEKLGKRPKQGPDPRPHGSILISTQIVEQSVDIDADWMLSELAPADMLLQRLGRLWRHDRHERPVPTPELAIVCARMPEENLADLTPAVRAMENFFGKGVWVYAPYILLRSFEALRHNASVRIPDDIRPLLEDIYSDQIPDTPLHKALYEQMEARAATLRQRALMAEADSLPTRNDDESTAVTRYNSRPSVTMLILRSLEQASGGDDTVTFMDGSSITISRTHRDFTVTKELYRNLVQVVPNEAIQAARQGPGAETFCQHFAAYEMPCVCIWNDINFSLSIFGSGADTGYAYHPLFGIYRASVDLPEGEPPGGVDAPEGEHLVSNRPSGIRGSAFAMNPHGALFSTTRKTGET